MFTYFKDCWEALPSFMIVESFYVLLLEKLLYCIEPLDVVLQQLCVPSC